MDEELAKVGHRPYPVPQKPWLMTQTWEDLLFIHWQVPIHLIQPLLPAELELDTFEGSAWIGIIPFKVAHQRFRLLPELPFLRSYLELNVRTYVKYKGFQGIYLFSLDASNPLTVLGAKFLSLPYKIAWINMKLKNQCVHFNSKRVLPNRALKLTAVYEPISAPAPTVPGSLDHWLLERYCLFTVRGGVVLRGDIHHEKWEICRAKAKIVENTAAPFPLPDENPLLHYCKRKKMYVWPLKEM